MQSKVVAKQDVVYSEDVQCGDGIRSHPKIYLKIGASKEISCPYCNKSFLLQEKQINTMRHSLQIKASNQKNSYII